MKIIFFSIISCGGFKKFSIYQILAKYAIPSKLKLCHTKFQVTLSYYANKITNKFSRQWGRLQKKKLRTINFLKKWNFTNFLPLWCPPTTPSTRRLSKKSRYKKFENRSAFVELFFLKIFVVAEIGMIVRFEFRTIRHQFFGGALKKNLTNFGVLTQTQKTGILTPELVTLEERYWW